MLSFSRLMPLALILVVAACGGSTSNGTSPSSTMVPAATPTAKGWQTACLDAEILAAESLNYDVEVTVSAPGLSRKYDILVSGEDYHLTGHLTIGEGYDVPPFSGTVELMEVGGTIYSKEEEGEWAVLDEAPAALDTDYRFVTLCPRVRGSLSEEVEVIGSTPARTFNVYRSALADSTDSHSQVTATFTYWIDDAGRLVQLYRIHRYPKIDDPTNPIYRYDGGTLEENWLVTGVGEPNVITAPAIL